MVSAAYLQSASDRIPITETGTYTPYGGSALTVTVERRPTDRNSPALVAGLMINADDVELVLRNDQLGGNTPRDGDTIALSGVTFRVKRAIARLAGTRHHCICVKHG